MVARKVIGKEKRENEDALKALKKEWDTIEAERKHRKNLVRYVKI